MACLIEVTGSLLECLNGLMTVLALSRLFIVPQINSLLHEVVSVTSFAMLFSLWCYMNSHSREEKTALASVRRTPSPVVKGWMGCQAQPFPDSAMIALNRRLSRSQYLMTWQRRIDIQDVFRYIDVESYT